MGARKALDSAPDLNDVCPLGTFGMHFSIQRDGVDQMTALRQLHNAGMKEGIFMWDPELKAYRKAIDAALEITKIGMKAKIAILPPGQDPGSADASVIRDAIRTAREVTRTSALKLRMANPFAA